jgi:hypothetical protein
MAEELVLAIVEVLGELVTEDELGVLAGDALIDGGGAEIVAGASDLLVGGVETWEEALAADAETQVIPKDLVEILNSTRATALNAAQRQTLFSRARYFGAWVGKEILKGAVIQLAFETWHLELKKNVGMPASPDAAFIALVGEIGEALKLTADATKHWRQWTIKHYHQRADYGVLTVDNIVLYRFEIFRSALADLDDELQKLALLIGKDHLINPATNMGKLQHGVLQYISACQKIADRIQEKEHLMVRAKLESRQEELQKARDIL